MEQLSLPLISAAYAFAGLLLCAAHYAVTRHSARSVDAGTGGDVIHDRPQSERLREAAFVGAGWGLWLVLATVAAAVLGLYLAGLLAFRGIAALATHGPR
jgi:hypothetical protein